MTTRLEEMAPGILHVRTDNQYQLTDTFLRLQEFYESPFEDIRGKKFSMERYRDLYAQEYGNFTYHVDWCGFNVPDDIVRDFYKKFPTLTKKEEKVKKMLKKYLDSKNKFYLIGTYKDGATVDHEVGHALYYLNSDYKAEMDAITDSLSQKDRNNIFKVITDKGYCEGVLHDEAQAYCATSNMIYIADTFGDNINWKAIVQYKRTFLKYKEEIIPSEDEDGHCNLQAV